MTDISNMQQNVLLTPAEAEFILGALDALVKDRGMSIAASALHVGMKIEAPFKEAAEALQAQQAAAETADKKVQSKRKK